jgi:hypothetical protein
LNVVPSRPRALKTLALPEFIRLRNRIKAANRDMLLSAPGRNIRGSARGDGGPKPEKAEDLRDHCRLPDKKAVKHRPTVLE